MKQEVNTIATFYTCEVCGFNSTCKERVEICEEQCKCKHGDFNYNFYVNILDAPRISKSCKICGKAWNCTITEKSFTKEELKIIYERTTINFF